MLFVEGGSMGGSIYKPVCQFSTSLSFRDYGPFVNIGN